MSDWISTYLDGVHEKIDEYGWMAQGVFDPDGDNPPFVYTIGLTYTMNHPELIIVGLSPDVFVANITSALHILSRYWKRFFFRSIFSGIASMIKDETEAISSIEWVMVILFFISSIVSGLNNPQRESIFSLSNIADCAFSVSELSNP